MRVTIINPTPKSSTIMSTVNQSPMRPDSGLAMRAPAIPAISWSLSNGSDTLRLSEARWMSPAKARVQSINPVTIRPVCERIRGTTMSAPAATAIAGRKMEARPTKSVATCSKRRPTGPPPPPNIPIPATTPTAATSTPHTSTGAWTTWTALHLAAEMMALGRFLARLLEGGRLRERWGGGRRAGARPLLGLPRRVLVAT